MTRFRTISQDRWLAFVRWGVIVVAIFVFSVVVYGSILMPDYVARHLSEFTPNDFWTYEQTQAGLSQLGWPAQAVVWAQIGRSLMGFLVTFSVGLLILWRRSRDAFGLYLAFAFLTFGLGATGFGLPLIERASGFKWLFDKLGAIGWQLFFIIFFFFPNGQTEPKWMRWVVWAWAGYILLYLFDQDFVNAQLVWIAFPLVFSALGSQIYRYFWRADAIQRQQTKWIIASIIVILVMFGSIIPVAFDSPTGPDYGTALVLAIASLFIQNAIFLLFPIALTVSILFYRLWDIDILIRRTLQYSILTGLLGLVYFGSVVLFQGIFRTASGETSSLAIVLSTLIIAALFAPLRQRVQAFIDRRFFRQKYDAAQALAWFAAVARDEVEMEKLAAAVVNVIEATVQPERVSVWFKQEERKK